jgi:hypothetical protein
VGKITDIGLACDVKFDLELICSIRNVFFCYGIYILLELKRVFSMLLFIIECASEIKNSNMMCKKLWYQG